MDRSKHARGRWGEDLAAAHLRRAGFTIVDRNWTFRSADLRGELDIIARRDGLVVICEVKTRQSSRWGGAVAAVDAAKQAQIRRLAAVWLGQQPGSVDVRFDVVAIDGVRLRHFPAAF